MTEYRDFFNDLLSGAPTGIPTCRDFNNATSREFRIPAPAGAGGFQFAGIDNVASVTICSFAAAFGIARSRVATLAMSLLLPYRTIKQIESAGNDQDHDDNISDTHRTSRCIYYWCRTASHRAVRSSKCCNGSHRPDHDQYFTDIPARSSLVISEKRFNDQLPTQALNICKFLCRSSSVTPK